MFSVQLQPAAGCKVLSETKLGLCSKGVGMLILTTYFIFGSFQITVVTDCRSGDVLRVLICQCIIETWCSIQYVC